MPGLMQAGTEITLPLTPHHLLFAKRKALPTLEISPITYQSVGQDVVDEANRTIRVHALNEIISWTGEIRRVWLEDGPILADDWENTEDGKAFREKS